MIKQDQLFTIEEVAKLCGLSRNAAYMHYRRGHIQAVKLATDCISRSGTCFPSRVVTDYLKPNRYAENVCTHAPIVVRKRNQEPK